MKALGTPQQFINTTGFPVQAYVVGIDKSQAGNVNSDPKGIAVTVDQFKVLRQVGVSTYVGSGAYPQVGETWTLNKDRGTWTFGARMVQVEPQASDIIGVVLALQDLGFLKFTGDWNELRGTYPLGYTSTGTGTATPIGVTALSLTCDTNTYIRWSYSLGLVNTNTTGSVSYNAVFLEDGKEISPQAVSVFAGDYDTIADFGQLTTTPGSHTYTVTISVLNGNSTNYTNGKLEIMSIPII